MFSFLYSPTLTPYMTTGKTIALGRQTFVGKVMSPLFNILSLSCFKIFSCFSHPYGKGSSPTCLCNLASATLGLSCFLLVAPPALSLTSTPASPTHSSLPWSRTVFLPGHPLCSSYKPGQVSFPERQKVGTSENSLKEDFSELASKKASSQICTAKTTLLSI